MRRLQSQSDTLSLRSVSPDEQQEPGQGAERPRASASNRHPAEQAGNPEEVPGPLWVMLEALCLPAASELLRALHLRLFPAATAKARREAELGPLARLLRSHGAWPVRFTSPDLTQAIRPRRSGQRRTFALSPEERWPVITRQLYDHLRPGQAPTSETLMRRHRASWTMICRIAGGLPLGDQRLTRSHPWLNAWRGRPGHRRGRPYSPEECLRAIGLCATALGRPLAQGLTVTAYRAWSAARRRRARQLGLGDPRLPNDGVIRQRFGSWQAALKAARRASGPGSG